MNQITIYLSNNLTFLLGWQNPMIILSSELIKVVWLICENNQALASDVMHTNKIYMDTFKHIHLSSKCFKYSPWYKSFIKRHEQNKQFRVFRKWVQKVQQKLICASSLIHLKIYLHEIYLLMLVKQLMSRIREFLSLVFLAHQQA